MENKEIDLITEEDAYQMMIEKINYVNQFSSKHFYESDIYYEYEILNKSIVFYKGRQRNPRTRSMYAKVSFDNLFKYYYLVEKHINGCDKNDEYKSSLCSYTVENKLSLYFSGFLIKYGDKDIKFDGNVYDNVIIYREGNAQELH
jgi:hypothetical protein